MLNLVYPFNRKSVKLQALLQEMLQLSKTKNFFFLVFGDFVLLNQKYLTLTAESFQECWYQNYKSLPYFLLYQETWRYRE